MQAIEEKLNFKELPHHNIIDFLNNPDKFVYNDLRFFCEDDCFYFVRDGFIYYFGDWVDDDYEYEIKRILEEKFNEIEGFYDGESIFINGDDSGGTSRRWRGARNYPIITIRESPNIIRFSYRCIENLVPNGMKRLFTTLDIIDYIPDEFKDLTKKEKSVRNKSKLKPPVGYNLLKRSGGYVWHRIGTVLFYDSKTKKTYLLGRDDDQYFGCELAGNPKTIEDAYLDLQPKEVRGKAFKRQGEWFGIEYTDKEIEKIGITKYMTHCTGIDLPNEEGGNEHNVYSVIMGVDNKGRVYFYRGGLTHSEHPDLRFDQWITFYKNTAVRSVSTDGVD